MCQEQLPLGAMILHVKPNSGSTHLSEPIRKSLDLERLNFLCRDLELIGEWQG